MSAVNKELTILVVEDNPTDLSLLKQLVHSGQLSVKCLHSADRVEEAVKILQACAIDIVLLNLTLPGSDGMDSFQRIRPAAGKIPVIILTGLSGAEAAVKMVNSGAQDYLVKEELTATLLAKSIRYSIECKRNLALQEKNDRFNKVIKATNEIIWDWNLLTNEVYVAGNNLKNVFGMDYVDTVQPLPNIVEWVHPEDREQVMNKIDRFIGDDDRMTLENEFRLRKADGTYAYVCDRSYKVYDTVASRPVRLVGSVQDITLRKNAEERFRQMFYNNPYPIIFYDLCTSTILEVNDAALKTYGYTRDEFVGLSWKDMVHEKETARVYRYLEELTIDKVIEKKLWQHKKKNGEVIMVEVTGYPVDYFGKTVRQALISDVTEKIWLQNELTQQQKLEQRRIAEAVLVAQENEKTALGQELHDNINQVLTAAKFSLEFALENPQKSNELVNKCIRFLSQVMQEIRVLCKTMIMGNAGELDLKKAIEEVAANILMRPAVKLDLQVDLDERYVNPNLKITLLRMIQEQLINIVKHAKATSVCIQLRGNSNEILLVVADDGKGFDPAKKREGVGITNITNRARLYNGRVEIHSAPGEGCRLKVVLRPGRPVVNGERSISQ